MVARTHSALNPDPIDIAVGARIRIHRRWLALSRSTLAKSIGVSFFQLQKYEKATNRVTASMLVKLAASLGTSVAALVGEEPADAVSPVVDAQLGTLGAADLLAAYAAIEDGELRRALLSATQGLARAAEEKSVEALRRRKGSQSRG